jgi:ABC-type sugar transport system substrate-binding protein
MNKFIFVFICILQLPAIAKPLNVVLVTPTVVSDPFWSQISAITQVAAKDLSIKLTIISKDSHIVGRSEQYQQIKEIVEQKNKPDYIIFMPYITSVLKTFNLLEQHGVKFVTIEKTFEYHSNLDLGRPKEKYKYWIGETFYDNHQAGRVLADYLITKAIKIRRQPKGGGRKLTAIGLAGDYNPESSKRNKGLVDAAHNQNIKLQQIITVHWDKDTAKKRVLQLLERHGRSDVVWCASDLIAFGALEAAKQVNLLVNKDIFIGGFDWTTAAIDKISKNELTASIGGDVFQGANMLIKIFDYHHGIDAFNHDKDFNGYPRALITIDNIDDYQAITTKNYWHNIDYQKFSKAKNKRAEDFTIENILAALAENKTSVVKKISLHH